MAKRFLNKKTHPFFFINESGEKTKYILIFGDEVDTLTGPAPSGGGWKRVKYRKRTGEMENPNLTTKRTLEMYFLDVGQGDAAFIVTPNNKKILVDGGLRDRALGFLIWKYRLDQPNNSVTIDYLVLSHGDTDHVEGLILLVQHPNIHVNKILHNGIAIFKPGYNTRLGNLDSANRLTTLHNTTNDLTGQNLAGTFRKWIKAVMDSGADYQAVHSGVGTFDIGDPDVKLEVLGPIREPGGNSLEWFNNKSHTINGHSVVFRLIYKDVRVLFTGDINIEGSNHLLDNPNVAAKLDAHILKAPHHGSHEYYQPFFNMIKPMVTIVSSGDSPDHGHPRAQFLGGIGLAGRSNKPLLFSTELAATFIDAGDPEAMAAAAAATAGGIEEPTTLSDLDFSRSDHNTTARQRFKKILPGIINVRTNGEKIYAVRRVNAWYQWESYGEITPLN